MTQTTTEYAALDFDGTERRANYRTVAYRIDILHICERKDAAAILFEIIYRWQIEVRKPEIEKEIEKRKKANMPPLSQEEVEGMMWVWMSYNDFVRECGGAVAYNTVIRMLDYLIDTVKIVEQRENHDPRHPDYEYRINMSMVRQKLRALPAAPVFLAKVPKKRNNKGNDSTQLGTVEKDSTQIGRRAHRYTQMGTDSTQVGIVTTQLGTEVYPNGGTSHTTHILTHIPSSQENTYTRDFRNDDHSASANASLPHAPDYPQIGEFIAERGGYYHPSKSWLKWDSLNAPSVICAVLTGEDSEDLSRKAEAIRLKDHLSQQHDDIELIFERRATSGTQYLNLAGDIVDPLAEAHAPNPSQGDWLAEAHRPTTLSQDNLKVRNEQPPTDRRKLSTSTASSPQACAQPEQQNMLVVAPTKPAARKEPRTTKAEQMGLPLQVELGPLVMPDASAAWNVSTVVLISEVLRQKRYTPMQRANQESSAKRMLKDFPEMTRAQFEEIFADWARWWREHDKGYFTIADLLVKGKNNEVRLQTALDRLEAQKASGKAGQSQKSTSHVTQHQRATSPNTAGFQPLTDEERQRNKDRMQAKYDAMQAAKAAQRANLA